MTRLGAEAWLAAAVIWMSIMLPSAAFGGYDGGPAHATADPSADLIRSR